MQLSIKAQTYLIFVPWLEKKANTCESNIEVLTNTLGKNVFFFFNFYVWITLLFVEGWQWLLVWTFHTDIYYLFLLIVKSLASFPFFAAAHTSTLNRKAAKKYFWSQIWGKLLANLVSGKCLMCASRCPCFSSCSDFVFEITSSDISSSSFTPRKQA